MPKFVPSSELTKRLVRTLTKINCPQCRQSCTHIVNNWFVGPTKLNLGFSCSRCSLEWLVPTDEVNRILISEAVPLLIEELRERIDKFHL